MSLFRTSKSSPSKTLSLGPKGSKAQSSELIQLINRMQSNADFVEKNILENEEKLKADTTNYNNRKPFQYQKLNADNLRQSEEHLKELFLDVDKAKRLKHPQSEEIDRDIKQLHERWVTQCAEYRELYEKIKLPNTGVAVDWPRILEQKQREVNAGTYGPAMPDVEKQVAQHNILHKEIEEYGSQIDNSSADPAKLAAIKKQYNGLLESSRWRKQNLSSLYDYMQGCTKELIYLNDQSNKITKEDWSDQMTDADDVRRQYENFKANDLMTQEAIVNNIQKNGEELVQKKHPATQTIQAHQDAVKNEWHNFLNLCLCQENHLKNVEDYKKFQDDTDTISKSLKKVNSDLDTKYKNYNRDNHRALSDLLLQVENDERTLLQNEKELADLKKRSTQIAPLKMRRTRPTKPVTVDTICDWDSELAEVARGEKYSLKDNSDSENWVVQSNSGVVKSIPGVCFNIPPPDPEATDRLNKLNNELAEVKMKHKKVRTELKNNYDEVSRITRPVLMQNTSSSQKEDPQGLQLLKKVDKIDGDLDRTEKEILNRMRVPVSRNAPTQDLGNRVSEQEDTARQLQIIGSEKDAVQRECENFLSKKPTGTAAAQLPPALSDMKNKYNDVSSLSKLYQEKAKAALSLENQIKRTDSIITSFENELAQENSIPSSANALQDRVKEIQKMKRDLAGKEDNLQQLNQNFGETEQCCSALQTNFQEFCPDLPKQEAEVRRLNDRYGAVAEQLNLREKKLQDADIAYQRFKSSSQDLSAWMNSLPNNQVKSSDGLSQVNYKLQSQKGVMNEIKRKEYEKDTVANLSHDLQSTLNDYDINNDKYRSSLDPTLSVSSAKKLRTTPLQDNIQSQEKDLMKRYTESAAASQQQLNQLEFAKNVMEKQEDHVDNVVVQRNVHAENTLNNSREAEILKDQLDEEKKKITDVQMTLEEHRRRLLILKNQRPIERIEEKEVVQYYRDPKTESEMSSLKYKIENEQQKKSSTQRDIEALNKKILLLENEKKTNKPQLLTKEVTQIEKDPLLDKEAANLRTEISRFKGENSVTIKDIERLKTEITILEQKRPNIKEKVVVKEVVKVEKDPQMLHSVRTLQSQIDEETRRRRTLEDTVLTLRNKIMEAERQISLAEPKVIVKEVKKVEHDPQLLQESTKLRSLLEEERHKSSLLTREITDLRARYNVIENQKPRVEIKEVVNEIFRVDPETEKEITNLRRELKLSSDKKSSLEQETERIRKELQDLRSQKPRIEQKEVTQEVVKLEKSPEILREIERLKSQQAQLTDAWNRSQDQVLKLRNERDEWKREKSKVETKLVTKELVKYENDPVLEKECERLRKEVREESQRRREAEEIVFNLQSKYLVLERKKPEEKVVVQEVVRLQKDPNLLAEHNRLNKSLDEEVKKRRNLEREVQQLRVLVEDKENSLDLQQERNKKLAVEQELRLIKTRIKELEESPAPVEEQIVREDVVKVERDPVLEKMTDTLRVDYNNEKTKILDLERECRNLQIKIDVLEREKSQEKTIYKEVIRVEKDRALASERAQVRDLLNKEKMGTHDAEQEIRRLSERISRAESSLRNCRREDSDLQRGKETVLREKSNIERELKDLERERQHKTLQFMEESKLRNEKTEMDRQRRQQLETEISLLESDILKEKDIIYRKENTARELQLACNKEEGSQNELQMRETNLSTRITILDPDTGKDMSPYEAYRRGLIDRNQYTQLQELECDWEEMTTLGPDGETTVLRDKKSGKQYSIDTALRDRRVTKEEYQLYKNGKIPISEFALLVAGETKPSSLSIGSGLSKSPLPSPTQQRKQSFFSQSPSFAPHEDTYPVAGVQDNSTNAKCSVRSALLKKLIDPVTAQKLLEAQAATGGIVDISTRERYSVHKASERGLVDNTLMKRLINAQKAFTGVEDPVTKQRLSVGEAVQKGWMPRDNALHYLQAQYLTGGLVDPNKAGRVDISDAVKVGMVDSETARLIQEEGNYVKDITDPISKEKINYKEAMERCIKDNKTGLLYLPAASTSQKSSYSRSFNY